MATRSTDAKIIQNDDETVDITFPDSSVEEEVLSSSSPTAAEVVNENPFPPGNSETKPPSAPEEATAQEEPSGVKESQGEEEDEELSRVSEGVKKRINKLTRKMREAERREKAALDFAKALQKEKADTEKQAETTNNSYLAEYENRLSLEETNLKTALHKAVETGDVDSQVEIQKRIAQHALDSEKLDNSKKYWEQQRAPAPGQAGEQPAVPPEQVQQAQQQAMPPDPKADDWAERNVWFGQDEPMTLTAFSIHKNLVATGIDPRTDEYYVELESRLKHEFPHKADQVVSFGGSAPVNRRPSGVAPATGAGTRKGTRNPNSVKLTQSEVAIAKKLGVSLQDYAKQVRLLQQNRQAST